MDYRCYGLRRTNFGINWSLLSSRSQNVWVMRVYWGTTSNGPTNGRPEYSCSERRLTSFISANRISMMAKVLSESVTRNYGF